MHPSCRLGRFLNSKSLGGNRVILVVLAKTVHELMAKSKPRDKRYINAELAPQIHFAVLNAPLRTRSIVSLTALHAWR